MTEMENFEDSSTKQERAISILEILMPLEEELDFLLNQIEYNKDVKQVDVEPRIKELMSQMLLLMPDEIQALRIAQFIIVKEETLNPDKELSLEQISRLVVADEKDYYLFTEKLHYESADIKWINPEEDTIILNIKGD